MMPYLPMPDLNQMGNSKPVSSNVFSYAPVYTTSDSQTMGTFANGGRGAIWQCLGPFLIVVVGVGDVTAISWAEARDTVQRLHAQDSPTP